MWFSFWLRKGKRSAAETRQRTQTSPGQRASFRPRLEALEDRTLPSGGMPYATASKTSELIADINYANQAGGTQSFNLAANTTFDLSKVNNSTNGNNGLPVITAPNGEALTIEGNGATIERGAKAPAFRLFDVAPGASLELVNVKLTDGLAQGSGAAAEGGAIYNQGTLVLYNTIVQGNEAKGSDGANGAVTSQLGQNLNGGPGADAAGGGVWSSGSVTLQGGTVFQSNTAQGGKGGAAGELKYSKKSAASYGLGGNGGSAAGGGLFVHGGSVNATSMSNPTLSLNKNKAVGGAGGSFPYYVVTTQITAGHDSAGVGGNGAGGGLYITGGTFDLSNASVNVQSNQARGGAGGIYTAFGFSARGGDAYGGGLGLAGAPGNTLDLSNATVKSNGASGGQGSYWGGRPVASAFSQGGGIYFVNGVLTLNGCTLSHNGAGYGGGIYNDDSVYASALTVNTSTLSGNSATFDGGGIENYRGTVAVSNSTLSGNSATFDGGGIFNDGFLTVSNSTVSGNTAGGLESAGWGGGIFNDGFLTVSNSTLDGNTAYSEGAGGGIANDGTVTVNNGSILSGNTAYTGGGIYDQYTLTVSNSTLDGNTAYGSGGGIATDDGTVTVSNSTLSGNSAQYGGGIYIYGGYYGTLTVSGSTLGPSSSSAGAAYAGNSAVYDGGGIYIDGGTVKISSSTVGGTVKVSNSKTLPGNSAQYGGGIYISAGTVTVKNCKISDNSATDEGGGIYMNGGTATVSGCTVSSNSASSAATNSGGGIYINAGTLTLNNTVFKNNKPDNIVGSYSGSGNTGLP